MSKRYPSRVRNPVKRWETPVNNEKDLGDDDWGSDVDMAESEEEDVASDNSLYEFVTKDENDFDFSVTEEEVDDETMTEESSDSEWEREEAHLDEDTFVTLEEEDVFDLLASDTLVPIGGTVAPEVSPTPAPLKSPAQPPQNTQDRLNVTRHSAGDIP